LQVRVIPYVDRATFDREYEEMTKVKRQFEEQEAAARGMVVEPQSGEAAPPPPPPVQTNFAVGYPLSSGFYSGYPNACS
jgi:hypothetical protein